MSYSERIPIILGANANPALTWTAQVKDAAGVNAGSPITTGFVYLGGGAWQWTHTFADGEWSVVFTSSDGDVLVGMVTQPSPPAAGSGGTPVTYTFTNQQTGAPVDGVQAWVTTDNDPEGNVVASAISLTNGTVTFMLDPGSYYLWEQRAGYNSATGTAFTVA